MTDISQEVRYRMLKYLAEHPEATQRQLASDLGVSVGKVNYCLRALVGKGLLKVRNFRNARRKATYGYLLTAEGIEEKVNVTYAFLRRKIAEYDSLSKEIEYLTAEVEKIAENGERFCDRDRSGRWPTLIAAGTDVVESAQELES